MTWAASALAMAERTGARGEDVLAAIVLGYEAAGRIGEAITPGFRTRGFHGCLVAIFPRRPIAKGDGSQVRIGLAGGANRIRTRGPAAMDSATE